MPANTLPGTLSGGLIAQGVPTGVADNLAALPPVGILFAAFLGINPIASLLGPSGTLASLPPANAARLTGTDFFPSLISDPFHSGLVLVFAISALMMVVAAVASWYAGVRASDELSAPDAGERLGEEPETYAPVEGEEVGELTGPLAHALRFPTAAPKDAS